MALQGHVIPISAEECQQLLGERQVARVAWASAEGMLILPVNFVFETGLILMLVSRDSVFRELADGRDVAVEVEDVDEQTATGWSVLIQGRAAAHHGDAAVLPQPWAPGDRDFLIAVTPTRWSGRSIAAD
ncbi:MAG: pyridoxamine 5'-phosphate oxidase family protein [Propioniciclava sp.]